MDVIAIARDTLEAIEHGHYVNPAGERVELATLVERCVAGTALYEPEAMAALEAEVLASPVGERETAIKFHAESTLAGARALATARNAGRVGVLNFASALSPGGGFLSGATAQEETLARSSGLYPSLQTCPAFYRFHHEQDDPIYSDRAIYSPGCPVFKDDDGHYLDQPYCVDFLTCPAPFAGMMDPRDPELRAQLHAVFYARGGKILALFAERGCDALVLGAWGCGAFCNDPEIVAEMFHHYLGDGGVYSTRFRRVRFSILAGPEGPRNYETFRRAFA